MDIVVTPGLDPAHDVLHYGRQALDAIFAPKSVAVIGARDSRQRRAYHRLEFAEQHVWRDDLPRQPQAPEHSRHQSLPES